MKKTMTANRITCKKRGNSGRGFTLVELIVVIVIIAVLAAVGIATALGYIKKSRFEQNSQSAVSVYQAAQTALSMKVANGTNDSWTKNLVQMKLTDDQITAWTKDLDTDNESTSVVLALTFNPKSASATEDSYLYNLLNDQFYDKTIFSGTMSVEFNVVASYAKGRIYYSSWVASAFYCSQNDADTKWSEVCIGNSTDDLPQREPYEYRRDTSLVGWYNGTPDSVTGPDGVCPVHIPKTVVNDLDGHIIADSTDTGYLFNLRNGETLDVSWAIFDYDDTYRSISNLDIHDEDITINLITEGTNRGNSESYDKVELYISQANLKKFRDAALNSTETITYENINSKTNITRVTRSALVDVQVKRGLTTGTWKFPMTITLVTGDDRIGCPDKDIGYYEYRLSLDCMMDRQSETETVNSRFNAERLFGTTPRNISATLTATFTHYLAKDQTESRSVNDVAAARAIDDPVYYTGLSSVQDKTSYCYMVVEDAAAYDGEDDNTEKITGKCVVNTLFGDLKYSDSLAATSWSSSGGNAVITSFRHLYNIRWIQAGTVKYTIVRDLNWYINNPGTLLVSDVKVFKKNGEFCSPSFTTNNESTSNKLHIVSFPALKELKEGQTLTSASSGGKTFSINNLQMRTASFRNNVDNGYGLICTNNGTVSNIYTNNFNLILAVIEDGSDSDYGSVSKGEIEISPYSYSSLNNSNRYVGGLVGHNCGTVGSADASADANIIMMSNAIIMTCSQTGNYWGTGTYPGVSGIIGKNEGSLSGTLEINGRFAVMGNGNVGAAIAYTNTDVGARIVVDGVEHGRSEFTLPKETTTGSNNSLSCVIAGTNNVGGAIGYMESCGLTYIVKQMTDKNVYYNSDTGEVTFDDWDATDYQIYVNLPEDSLIVELFNGTSSSNGITSGGAIGNMLNCSGNYMSIRVKNLGSILTRNKDWNWNEVGGAIGRDKNSNIATTYIFVYNGDGALGSRLDDNNSPLNNVEHGGGVYGLLETTNGRKFYLDVVNDGTKISAISNNDGDNQGAGGAIGSLRSGSATIVANVVNKTGAKFVYYSDVYSKKNNGVGGAIGTIQNNDSVYLSGDSHIYVENSGYIHANYNVGGAVGVMSINHGDIYANNADAEITGNYCVGGAVGWAKKAEDGEIQSILSETTVSGNEFVGGAAGRVPNLQGGTITTKVYGSSEVSGVGSVVGGVCGDVRVQGDGTGSLVLNGNGSKLEVSTSKDGVGGVVGLLRANQENKAHVEASGVILNVKGAVSVGGAIGKLRSTSWEDNDNANANTNNALMNNKTKNNINIYVDVVLLHPSTIEGTENVGGAIGFVHCSDYGIFGGYVGVKTESGSSEDSAIISGTFNVGGAIGHFGSCYPDKVNDDSKIVVDFTDSPVTIESTVSATSNANLGGAVGHFDADKDIGNQDCKYVINADLGSSSLLAEGSNVGGAIGLNKIHNGIISASTSGAITGNNYVSGGIGYNNCKVTSVESIIGENGSAEISGSGSYIGGAIGYNNQQVGAVSVDIMGNSSILGWGNCIGGAAGFSLRKIGEVSVVLDEGSLISGGHFVNDVLIGGECVGGAIGLDEGELPNLSVTISGGSTVDGGINIGGAIGKAATDKITWDLSIASVEVTIKNDNAISGYSNLGGAIGQVGTPGEPKWENIGSISVIFDNVSKPILQGDSDYENACIGGVIGHHFRGTINSISLSGTGGEVNVRDDSDNPSAPDRSYDDAIIITGKGKYLGGIIGKSGGSGATNDAQSNSKIINIAAEGPDICVVSEDDSSYVGGWIGGCYSYFSGGSANTKTTYNVSTVKVVYSNADYIGGVCGKAVRSTNFDVYMNMTVDFSDAIVAGRAAVGGAFGELSAVKINGRLDITLKNGTRIGDYQGSLSTIYGEDTVTDGCICVEAGGAIGIYRVVANQNTSAYISVRIGTEDQNDTSMIFAGCDVFPSDSIDFRSNSGVGGAVGFITSYSGTQNYGHKDCSKDFEAYFYVLSYSSSTTVYSKAADVGGFAGCSYNVNLQGCFSTAVVRGDGDNTNVGGFIGRMDSGKINNCYCGGHTVGGQYIPLYENVTGKKNVGGFVGYVQDGSNQIIQSYSTASVNGEDCVGGFVGYSNTTKDNFFQECYCTGFVFNNSESATSFGSFAGYSYSNKNFTNCKVVDKINADLVRVGNYTESQIESSRIMRAKWNGAGTNYIKKDANSVYRANPFDSTLMNEDGSVPEFPLRTFISVELTTPERPNKHWEGVHYGDWPIIPIEDEAHTIRDGDISFVDEVHVYNGASVEPDVIVKKGNDILKRGTDYEVVYWRNNKTGTAAAIVVGTGKYYGNVKKPFEITLANISSPDFRIEIPDSQPYKEGEPVIPVITIKYTYKGKEVVLVENRDYTLVFENNINPGTATVKITGIENYEGEVEKTFIILPLYDIFFSTGEGTAIPQQRIFEGGNAVKPKENPTRTGYSFGGWYADENCETEYDFSAPVMENITIYAKWIPEKYEVTFEVNGGNETINPMPVEYGSKISSEDITKPTKDNYTFTGWFTDELCTEEYDYDSVITGAFKLYAGWVKKPIVTFDAKGGDFDITDVMIEYNDSVSEPENEPTLDGYTFLGWYSDEECNNEYDFDTKLTADITLYAKWGKKPTVTFYIDADHIVPVTIAYGAKASSVVPEIPEKDGWTPISPLKWYTDLDANIVYDMDAEVTEDVTIYLGWLKTWKFTFHTGDGATVYGENGVLVIIHGRRLPDVLDPVEPVREGYKFIDWYTDPDFTNRYNDWGATSDTVLYAKWEKDPDAT